MRKLLLLPLLATTLLVSACNTMAGIGKDMEAAGAAVKSTADDAKH
jgi:entericidin B